METSILLVLQKIAISFDSQQEGNMLSPIAVDRVRRDTSYGAPVEVERERRDTPYGAPAPYYAPVHHGPKGKVGPVYTFVKTDSQVRPEELVELRRRFYDDNIQANFKWGVRHRAGAQYGRRRRRDIPYGAPASYAAYGAAPVSS